jgi:branched-chain amino acid transport system substrate-binding protein
MRRPSARTARTAAVTILAAASLAACGLSSTGTPSTSNNGGPSGTPIKVGISLSETGQFSADGLACLRGYQLWAADVNSHGGLLGRPVRLVVLNDNSDQNTVKANYTKLITQDHVNLVLGPFSSLLTVPAATVANKYGFAMTAGSATAPIVYAASLPNLFSTSAPVATQMEPFANWVAALPPGQRPKSAAYAMVDDPFADPPVIRAQSILEKAGVATVYNNANALYEKTTTAALAADADKVAAAHPQIVLIGSVDVPTVAAFINEFKRLRFDPQMIIAAAGPDQGQQFLNQIGTSNADGIMVPNTWYGGFPNALSHVMVQEYIAKYGGTASDINGDVAEAYSAGQVMANAVDSVGLSQAKIIAFLHSRGTQVNTVQGLAQWGKYVKGQPSGQNVKASAFVFQWQAGAHFVQVLSLQGKPSPSIVFPKPSWTTGGV